jgi:hypothetical protein
MPLGEGTWIEDCEPVKYGLALVVLERNVSSLK